ncbi:hypothetical protein P7K49_039317, partial [Saguinus oedipus]
MFKYTPDCKHIHSPSSANNLPFSASRQSTLKLDWQPSRYGVEESAIAFPQACLAGAWLSADVLATAESQGPSLRLKDEMRKHTNPRIGAAGLKSTPTASGALPG